MSDASLSTEEALASRLAAAEQRLDNLMVDRKNQHDRLIAEFHERGDADDKKLDAELDAAMKRYDAQIEHAIDMRDKVKDEIAHEKKVDEDRMLEEIRRKMREAAREVTGRER